MLLNDATSKKLKKKNHRFPSSCKNLRGLLNCILSFLTYSQIWLFPLVDDHQCIYIIKLEKRNPCTNVGMEVEKLALALPLHFYFIFCFLQFFCLFFPLFFVNFFHCVLFFFLHLCLVQDSLCVFCEMQEFEVQVKCQYVRYIII